MLIILQVKKTEQSYARVYDAYLPIYELDEDGNLSKRVALLRTRCYLEDLGPSDQIQSRENTLGL